MSTHVQRKTCKQCTVANFFFFLAKYWSHPVVSMYILSSVINLHLCPGEAKLKVTRVKHILLDLMRYQYSKSIIFISHRNQSLLINTCLHEIHRNRVFTLCIVILINSFNKII
jgi:hypothetical protein